MKQGTEPARSELTWRKSSHSASNGNCTEVADLPEGEGVAVGDTKDPGGPILVFGKAAWIEFTGAIKRGETFYIAFSAKLQHKPALRLTFGQ
jgi:hypothetical protein